MIERHFPQVANAYELTMGEFLDRLGEIADMYDAEGSDDPLSRVERELRKRMRENSKKDIPKG